MFISLFPYSNVFIYATILQVIMAPSSYDKLNTLLTRYVKVGSSKLNIDRLRECLQSLSTEEVYQLLTTVRDKYRATAIHHAVWRDHTELITQHCNSVKAEQKYQLLMIQVVYGLTALHSAALIGHKEAAMCIYNSVTTEQRYQLLTIQATFGHTPLHYAAWQGHTKLIAHILDSVEPAQRIQLLEIGNINSDTALDVAKKCGNQLTAAEIKKYTGQETAPDCGNYLCYFTCNIFLNVYLLLKICT